MAINPITLDKIEPTVIRRIETKLVDTIVHEIKGAEIQKESKNNNRGFNQDRQNQASKQFESLLAKYSIKFEYKVTKNKVKIKVRNKDGSVLIETELDDVEDLFKKVKLNTGGIIDIKG